MKIRTVMQYNTNSIVAAQTDRKLGISLVHNSAAHFWLFRSWSPSCHYVYMISSASWYLKLVTVHDYL